MAEQQEWSPERVIGAPDNREVMGRGVFKELHRKLMKYPRLMTHFYMDITLDEQNEAMRNFEQAHKAGRAGSWWRQWRKDAVLSWYKDEREAAVQRSSGPEEGAIQGSMSSGPALQGPYPDSDGPPVQREVTTVHRSCAPGPEQEAILVSSGSEEGAIQRSRSRSPMPKAGVRGQSSAAVLPLK
jgi:hypothetical protein